jgi:hypothetical protein
MHGSDVLDIRCSYELPRKLVHEFGRKPVLYVSEPGPQPSAAERQRRDDAVYRDPVEQQRAKAAEV